VAQAGSQLILFASAWCNSHPDDPPAVKLKEPDVEATLSYWVHRLAPLVGSAVAFVVADRVGSEPCAPLGREGAVVFCGGSCHVAMQQVQWRGCLDGKQEAVLICNVPVEPLAAETPGDREEDEAPLALAG
jgi:hypothetical protein